MDTASSKPYYACSDAPINKDSDKKIVSKVAKKAKGNVLASFHIQLAGPFEAHKDVKAFVNNQMSGLKQKKIFFVNFLC